MQEVNTTQDPGSIASEITEMVNKEIIENDLSDRLIAVHKSSFKRLFNKEMNISVFAEDRIDSEGKDKASKTKHCRFVEVTQNGKSMFISKTTAVWLLQEGERVSTDRLFRVRSKQPYILVMPSLKYAVLHIYFQP